ncbi:hypothetical protein D5F01_LYC15213 [Larimichthys crocea]|uniref:Uncharacterized protein n=1 Tax=Larimichthys crocea TaxID=215358 RepID=A0A6G0I744_LARCR|nr:hypothetical protein D5F01_LYC15213 [Larimichthys crocea]
MKSLLWWYPESRQTWCWCGFQLDGRVVIIQGLLIAGSGVVGCAMARLGRSESLICVALLRLLILAGVAWVGGGISGLFGGGSRLSSDERHVMESDVGHAGFDGAAVSADPVANVESVGAWEDHLQETIPLSPQSSWPCPHGSVSGLSPGPEPVVESEPVFPVRQVERSHGPPPGPPLFFKEVGEAVGCQAPSPSLSPSWARARRP